jgi:hypothetical protein
MALAEEWADGAVGGLGRSHLAVVEPDERFVVAPVGYRTEVPVDGGGQPGWGLEARPPGTCERRSADWAEPGLSHLVLGQGARVDDPDESVAMMFHRCSFCRTALISVGVSASRADERPVVRARRRHHPVGRPPTRGPAGLRRGVPTQRSPSAVVPHLWHMDWRSSVPVLLVTQEQ